MEILKTKLQIFLGIVICVLIYQHMHKPPQAQPEVTMDAIEQQAASGKLDSKAKAAADSMMSSGDIGEFQKQLGAGGLMDNN